jgi:thiamine pyrophosphokinase
MSSHHIVREKQEPALLILGLDGFDDEQLGQILEWSPTVITTPIIAEKLISSGIKVDWIITDETDEVLQSDIKQLPVLGDTIISSALKHLTAQGYPAVNIVTDDFELADYLPYTNKINLVILYNQQKIYAVTTGFSKWKTKGEDIRLISHPTNLQTKGLSKINDSQFKTVADGFFSLSFSDPYLFISESL